ncbi:hypothetical protein [Streptomyces sp. NPDC050504]|uniref:hypothetical protein n=1 Tax=Streptomyces sp. NPDC050504 TaxID=3365618 RepID=UPI00378D166E
MIMPPAGRMAVGPEATAVTRTPLGVVPVAVLPFTLHLLGYSDPTGTATAGVTVPHGGTVSETSVTTTASKPEGTRVNHDRISANRPVRPAPPWCTNTRSS